jgi:GTP-binding protein
MEINKAEFICSLVDYTKLPMKDKAEYAFIGRSNVGKSSLINYLTGRKKLAKTSVTPGKTQTINLYLINEEWVLADLPGYGYAKVSKTIREKFDAMIKSYLKGRMNLANIFILIDSTIPPQNSDLEHMQFMAANRLPFSIIFTKTDRESRTKIEKNIELYKERLSEDWQVLPPWFLSSSDKKVGREIILEYIEDINRFRNGEGPKEG